MIKISEIAVVGGSECSKWDDLNSVSREVGRFVRNKEREYPREKINGLVTSSKDKDIIDLSRVISELNWGYSPLNKLMKDDDDDVLADSNNILNRWKKYFCQLLNVHNVSDVSQI
jgi:hypothetical protein